MVIDVSVTKNFYIAFEVPIVHVNRFRDQFFLMSALSKVIFWFSTVFSMNERTALDVTKGVNANQGILVPGRVKRSLALTSWALVCD